MHEQLQERLQGLRAEFEAGQKMLAELEARRNELQQTMLRISGAIQILEEMLEAAPSAASLNGQEAAHELPTQ